MYIIKYLLHTCRRKQLQCLYPVIIVIIVEILIGIFLSSFAVPRVAFNSSDYTVMEGGSITLGIQLLDDITQPLTLTIRTEDDSAAVSASDYTPLDQNITFHPRGDASMTVIVEALADDPAEMVESFRVILSQPSLGIEESATVRIIDSNGNRR
jgi:hypothetical protein